MTREDRVLEGAMDDYQHGVMAGMNNNVERLRGQKPTSSHALIWIN